MTNRRDFFRLLAAAALSPLVPLAEKAATWRGHKILDEEELKDMDFPYMYLGGELLPTMTWCHDGTSAFIVTATLTSV